jgi:hypothetical protein
MQYKNLTSIKIFHLNCNKVSFLYLKETIGGILAFVMLLLFSFSITPKKYLHALLANHTDNRFQAFTDEASVSQKGFNCDTDDIVVKAPFVGAMKSFVFSLSPIFPDI